MGTKFERLFAAPLSTSQQLISRIFWYETIQYRKITGSYLCRSPQPPTERKNKNTASGNCPLQNLLIGYEKRRIYVGKNEIDLTLAK